MTDIPYLEHLHSDGSALAAAARRDMGARVPSCPDWNVSELVEHVAGVYRKVAERLRRRSVEGGPPEIPPAPTDDQALIAWYEDALQGLEGLLAELPDDSPAWSWWPPDQTAGFWRRRMAQESAVHRWDAENAVGEADAIDPELARDGIDEFLDIYLADDASYSGTPGSVHLHRTDGEGEWILRLEVASPTEIGRGHEKGDAAVRGTASDLLLLLWRRKFPSQVEVLGDAGLVDELWDYLGPEES